MIDIETFTRPQLEYVKKVYSGFNLFGNDNKWHPYIKFEDKYFVFTHTKPEKSYIELTRLCKFTGDFYGMTLETMYLTIGVPPSKTANKLGGVIYFKPFVNFLSSNGVSKPQLVADNITQPKKRKRKLVTSYFKRNNDFNLAT